MNNQITEMRRLAPVLVAFASLLLVSACGGVPACNGSPTSLGAPNGSVIGVLPGNPTGGSAGNGYGGATVATPDEIDTVNGTPCE
ncbi:MAG TPA: hypothetical protein VGG27_10930 [Magnetospirillaceae bacterium]|jgi:hypothetical protein